MTPHPPSLSHKHTRTQTHTSTPTSCASPLIKLTLSILLLKHAELCQQALVSCKQRNQKCEGFLRHGWGLLIPSYWLFLFFFLLPSVSSKQEKKELQFLSCLLAHFPPGFFLPFSQLSYSFMALCVRLHGHDEGPQPARGP